jgi:hypothetical protein
MNLTHFVGLRRYLEQHGAMSTSLGSPLKPVEPKIEIVFVRLLQKPLLRVGTSKDQRVYIDHDGTLYTCSLPDDEEEPMFSPTSAEVNLHFIAIPLRFLMPEPDVDPVSLQGPVRDRHQLAVTQYCLLRFIMYNNRFQSTAMTLPASGYLLEALKEIDNSVEYLIYKPSPVAAASTGKQVTGNVPNSGVGNSGNALIQAPVSRRRTPAPADISLKELRRDVGLRALSKLPAGTSVPIRSDSYHDLAFKIGKLKNRPEVSVWVWLYYDKTFVKAPEMRFKKMELTDKGIWHDNDLFEEGSEDTLELEPAFAAATTIPEIKQVAKYLFMSAAEDGTVKLGRSHIPHCPTFTALLKRVCNRIGQRPKKKPRSAKKAKRGSKKRAPSKKAKAHTGDSGPIQSVVPRKVPQKQVPTKPLTPKSAKSVAARQKERAAKQLRDVKAVSRKPRAVGLGRQISDNTYVVGWLMKAPHSLRKHRRGRWTG